MEPLKKLVVHGTKEENQDGSITYILESSNRDVDNRNEIEFNDNEELLELTLDDGTTWMVDPSTLHEVFPEMDPATKPSSQRDGNALDFVLPSSVDSPATDRGIIGKIAIKLLTVFVKKKVVPNAIENLAKKLENKQLQNNIPDDSSIWKKLKKEDLLKNGAELFKVNQSFEFELFDRKLSKKPFFLFIHGTSSDTFGAFQDLADSQAWKTLFDVYGDNVIAFQHRTLTESPLQNVVKLVKMLPNNASLHIISHSRGGIVGDILSKYGGDLEGAHRGFNEKHISLLEAEEDREDDIKCIEELNKIFKTKTITVDKFIRVACPAAGTKLASKRLDHILNVFGNLLPGIFGDILKELLSAAVASKDDVDVLPGLEAQNPDSPFIKILNDPSEEVAIDGKSLVVISGNGSLSVSGSGLLVILGKLFYWQRNDLVVNTDSMYLGVNRMNNIQYFFDQGPAVNHVKYFENKQTLDAIDLAFKALEGELIPGFKSIPQTAVPSSDRALVEYGELYPPKKPPSGRKPIVVLLPGIMGSNLERLNKELWLHYGNILTGGLTKLNYSPQNKIEATSVVKTSYFKLYEWLSAKYDVVVFPFDWRKPLPDAAADFNEKIKELMTINQPIKIIGHSMGGVLVRDFIIHHDQTWNALNKSEGFKLVFLGSPLGGSHRILTVLFGKDAIINKLAKLDLFHTKKRLLDMFSKFPGILGLLPLTKGPDEDYASIATWKKMRTVFGKENWPLPSNKDLNNFKKYRDNVLEKRDDIDYSNMVYIAGKDKMTPIGYYLDSIPPKEKLYFLYTSEGDQSVSWKLGIPEQLKEQKSVYYAKVSHGALANEPDIFDSIEEILSTGSTRLLSKNPPADRGVEKVFRAEPDIDFDISSAGLEKTIFGMGDQHEVNKSEIPVSVTISNGDLRYSSYPVIAGHFLNDGVLYAEKAIDSYLQWSLTNKHSLGLYPGEIGSNAIFSKMDGSDFEGAVIVGLGEPDQLTSLQLSKTVEQGVLNYLLSLLGKEIPKTGVGISALVMASGYGGLTVESSMKAVITGVNNANLKMKLLGNDIYHIIRHLEFIERYSNRSLNCMYILNEIATKENINYNIVIGNKKIQTRLGIRKRIPLDTTEDWWNRITVKYKPENEHTGELSSMVFGASTSDSREEENQLFSSTPLIDLFISEVSTKNQWSECTAKTLFELLIPNDLKEKLKRKGNISWILDAKTASYPWELLQDNTINAKPLCINAGMIRQLSTKDYRKDIKRVATKGALVIADPILNGYVGQLPGAKDEGIAVQETLQNAGYPVTALIGKDASSIITDFFCKDYSIIHLAGHGVFNPKNPKHSGMVIGKELFLTVFEIQQLPVVPDLVFVNCCHLGSINTDDEKFYQDRYKLAANIGTELIRIGVKAVIAAGWVVNDEAALEFSKVFYERMLSGDNFGDAVKKARNSIYENYPDNNTWGAYQCYGDPFFQIKNTSKGEWYPHYIVPQEAENDLDNMINDIDMGIRTDINFIDDLEKITEAVLRDVTETAEIVERQTKIYYELAKYEEAVEKFEKLLSMERADFSFSSMEKYCNIRAKLYVKKVFQYGNGITPKIKKEAYENALIVIRDLEMLLFAGETGARLNMLASTYKRVAMLAPDKNKRINAFKKSMSFYLKAIDKAPDEDTIYPLVNAIEISAILVLSKAIKPEGSFTVDSKKYKVYSTEKASEVLTKKRENLEKRVDKDNLDYWNMLAFLNLDFCLLMINEKEEKENERWEKIINSFDEIWQKAGSEGKKLSELEHLKFLIYSLKKAINENTNTFLAYKDKATSEDLGVHIKELRAALTKLKEL